MQEGYKRCRCIGMSRLLFIEDAVIISLPSDWPPKPAQKASVSAITRATSSRASSSFSCGVAIACCATNAGSGGGGICGPGGGCS